MEDLKPLRKEDFKTLKEMVRTYFIMAFYACGGNRKQISKVLGINERTVREHIKTIGLHLSKPIEIPPPKEEEKKEDEIKDTGYRNVTPRERDDWYNRDRF
jgi:hypothetical protein